MDVTMDRTYWIFVFEPQEDEDGLFSCVAKFKTATAALAERDRLRKLYDDDGYRYEVARLIP